MIVSAEEETVKSERVFNPFGVFFDRFQGRLNLFYLTCGQMNVISFKHPEENQQKLKGKTRKALEMD